MTDVPHIGPDPAFPARPEHEDFDVLSALITALEEEADEGGDAFDHDAVLALYVDPTSLTYLAIQRAFHSLKVVTSADAQAKIGEVVWVTTIYREAFLMGCRFQRHRDFPGTKEQ